MNPENLALIFQTATKAHQAGRLKDAETGYRTVLSFDQNNPFCLQQYGMLLAQLGRPRDAVPHLEKSVKIRADIPAFWNNLGELYRQVDRLVESMQAFHRALRLAPLFPEAHYNLANVLKQLGRHPEAVTHYHEAVRVRPNYERAWYNLGNTLREEGRVVPAVAAYREALKLQPDWGDCHLNLANALYDQRQLDDAAAEYRRAVALKPDDPDLEDSLGNCLVAAGRVEEAVAAYARARKARPDRWLRALRSDLLAPPVPPNSAFIEEYRATISTVLGRYAEQRAIDPSELHNSGAEPPMLLAYQGRDDRPLKTQFAAFYRDRLPQLDPPPPRDGKPALGVVVTHGHEGVFARCLGELIARLDRNLLDVKLIASRSGANVLNFMLPKAEFEYVILPERVDHANDLLRQVGFDLLLYWEIGTDSMNYFLPMYRPARQQVHCWGWPVTSGMESVEAFLSWDLLEPAEAEKHYSEHLVCLKHLPTYYLRPPLPANVRGKEAFGFRSDDHLYLCQQNVRKYHPAFDTVLADILRTDPAATIGIIADEQPTITEMLMTRLRGVMPDVADRLRVLGRLEREPYLELVAAADVILDTPHYGGGANTVLDCVAAGSPIVTWTGPFHRGRWATAVNTLLGLGELNATALADYAAIATRLAGDPDRRAAVRQQIRQTGTELFENHTAVTEWQQWILNATPSR